MFRLFLFNSRKSLICYMGLYHLTRLWAWLSIDIEIIYCSILLYGICLSKLMHKILCLIALTLVSKALHSNVFQGILL